MKISNYKKELNIYQEKYSILSEKIIEKRKEIKEIENKFNKEYMQKNIPLIDLEIQQMQNQINEILNPTIKIKRKSWNLER